MVAGRAMAVLRAVVEEYVGTCAPVGSKALVDRHGMGVSSATVRNDLAGLERSGHLTHPHVSAGRIPTDLGYRAVVEDGIPFAHGRAMDSVARPSRATSLRGLSRELARLTRCLAVVSEPAPQGARVARVSLTRCADGRVACVAVFDDGHVASRSLRCPIPDDELARVEEAASEACVGERIGAVAADGRLTPGGARFLVAVVACVRALASEAHPSEERSGMAFLLAQPEFKDPQVVCVVADALEEADLAPEGPSLVDGAGLMVSIGGENADERLRRMSVVAKEYHAFSGVGYVACVGPTRMDYPLVIGAVEAASERARAIVSEG